jgi:CheY-like chemotaxis protein
MVAPRRIVVVDDDAKVRQLIEYRLRPPEFEFFGFSDGREALKKLPDIRPHLIVSDIMMPDIDGRLFFQAVKGSPTLQDVPFLFVSAVRADADVIAALDAGADAFLVKPFPVSQLVARIRTTLGATGEAVQDGPGAARAPMGVTPLPEDESGRPEPPPEVPFAELEAAVPEAAAPAPVPAAPRILGRHPSEAAAAKGLPDTSSDDFFDMLLAAQAAGESRPARPVEIPPKAIATPSRPAPEGRFSMVEVNGKGIQVRTEVRPRPTFAVVTTVAKGGRPLRRIETAWEHPLDRVEDRPVVERQIELQHDQALAMIEDLIVEAKARRVFWGSHERSVDGAILCRAMTVISDRLRTLLGAEAVLGLLRRSLGARSQERSVLRSFLVRNDGTVWCDRGRSSRISHDAVAAVAAWASDLLAEAGRTSNRAGDVRVRQVTRSMADELERLGFYTAFDGLAEPAGRARRGRLAGQHVPRTL